MKHLVSDTIVWHIDDLKISPQDEKVVDDIIKQLNLEFGDCDLLSVSEGQVHDYWEWHLIMAYLVH